MVKLVIWLLWRWTASELLYKPVSYFYHHQDYWYYFCYLLVILYNFHIICVWVTMGKVCCVIIPWNITAQQQLFSTSLCPSYQQTKCAADTCERGVNELYNYFECNNLNCIYIYKVTMKAIQFPAVDTVIPAGLTCICSRWKADEQNPAEYHRFASIHLRLSCRSQIHECYIV